MPRPPNHEPLPLMGLIEIAQSAGVQRAVVTMWRKRYPDFPAPVAELKIGPVFWGPDVRRWLADTGRDVDCARSDIGPGKSTEQRLESLKEYVGREPR